MEMEETPAHLPKTCRSPLHLPKEGPDEALVKDTEEIEKICKMHIVPKKPFGINADLNKSVVFHRSTTRLSPLTSAFQIPSHKLTKNVTEKDRSKNNCHNILRSHSPRRQYLAIQVRYGASQKNSDISKDLSHIQNSPGEKALNME